MTKPLPVPLPTREKRQGSIQSGLCAKFMIWTTALSGSVASDKRGHVAEDRKSMDRSARIVIFRSSVGKAVSRSSSTPKSMKERGFGEVKEAIVKTEDRFQEALSLQRGLDCVC